MKKLLFIILGIGFLFFYIGRTDKSGSTYSKSTTSTTSTKSLMTEMNYLNDISEIGWWEVDDNDVYINFNTLPSDWNMIVRAVALKGNKTTNFGVHVWVLSGKQKGWKPRDGGHIKQITARYGKIE